MKLGGSQLRIDDKFMTWLITGGSGQLGTAMSLELEKNGVTYISLDSKDLDITQIKRVNHVISELSPTVIVNCAAWTDVDVAESHEELAAMVNCVGPENLASAARRCNAKFVHISTDYVFSGIGHSPWGISSQLLPQTAYGRTKAEGEIRVLTIHPEKSFVVRTAWLYSPWGKNFAKTMIKLALNAEHEVHVVNDQEGQPTSATDLASQIFQLVHSNSPVGVYHGTNSGSATWFEFAQVLFEKAGADMSRVIPVDTSKFPRLATRPKFSVLDHSEWGQTSVQKMREWHLALDDSFPLILQSVLQDGERNA
jgi:dTDP-4-dehydrorhamnose reductase